LREAAAREELRKLDAALAEVRAREVAVEDLVTKLTTREQAAARLEQQVAKKEKELAQREDQVRG
jgi:hypothetical protein